MEKCDHRIYEKNISNIPLVRKRAVFPGFNMLVHWVAVVYPASNYNSWTLVPYIFVVDVLRTSSLSLVLPSTPERTQVVHSLLPVVSGAETSISAHACTRYFWSIVFLSHFLLPRVHQPLDSMITVWFIYLFNLQWAVQLRYSTIGYIFLTRLALLKNVLIHVELTTNFLILWRHLFCSLGYSPWFKNM